MTLGSIGVVYGDIGTSPLYALRVAPWRRRAAARRRRANPSFGVLSLIFWALILVVTVKYVFILLRADNNGEGGTLALMALAHRALAVKVLAIILARHHRGRAVLWRCHDHPCAVGAVGGRGLGVAAPGLETYVVPLTVVILRPVRRPVEGHGKVAAFFGPYHALVHRHRARRLVHIAENPGVLRAFNPTYGLAFCAATA